MKSLLAGLILFASVSSHAEMPDSIAYRFTSNDKCVAYAYWNDDKKGHYYYTTVNGEEVARFYVDKLPGTDRYNIQPARVKNNDVLHKWIEAGLCD